MAKITKFEDLICWQQARELVKLIYDLSELKRFSQDDSLKNQIRRAAVSVMSNIAKGFSRFHRKEFVRFLDISKSSLSEARIRKSLYPGQRNRIHHARVNQISKPDPCTGSESDKG